MPWSLNFCDLVTYGGLKILFLGLVCGSFQFVSQSSVPLPSFYVVYSLLFPLSNHSIDHMMCNQWLSCFPAYSQYLVHTSWYCSTALPHSHFHILLHWVFLLEYFTICCWAYSFSRPQPGYPFWSFTIFFTIVQMFTTCKLWLEEISAPGIVCTSFLLFQNWCFTSIQSKKLTISQ